MKKIILGTIFGLSLFSFFGVANAENKYTAQQICNLYSKNEVKGDILFKGNEIYVTGRVDEISKSWGYIYVSLDCIGIASVRIKMQSSETEKIANLDQGDLVTIRATIIEKGVFDTVRAEQGYLIQ